MSEHTHPRNLAQMIEQHEMGIRRFYLDKFYGRSLTIDSQDGTHYFGGSCDDPNCPGYSGGSQFVRLTVPTPTEGKTAGT